MKSTIEIALLQNGCSYDEFIQQMKDDDEFDAALTAKGRSQAKACGATEACQAARGGVELICASPLSRALDTANLAFPDAHLPRCVSNGKRRVCLESLREINSKLREANEVLVEAATRRLQQLKA